MNGEALDEDNPQCRSVIVLISFVTQRFTEVAQRTTEISQYKYLIYYGEEDNRVCSEFQ